MVCCVVIESLLSSFGAGPRVQGGADAFSSYLASLLKTAREYSVGTLEKV